MMLTNDELIYVADIKADLLRDVLDKYELLELVEMTLHLNAKCERMACCDNCYYGIWPTHGVHVVGCIWEREWDGRKCANWKCGKRAISDNIEEYDEWEAKDATQTD